MDSILYTRVKELCAEHGVSITKLEAELGFGPSAIQKWKTSSTPNATSVIKIARRFGVSTDYLLGETDIAMTAEGVAKDADIISLQRARSKMSPRDRERMMQLLRIGFESAFAEEG